MDWECGGRDRATLERLLARLKRWNPRLHCTDDWAAYQETIPQGRLHLGKDQTHGIERDHARQRHWLARCHNILGILLQHTGRAKEAQTAFAEALALREQLAAEFPDSIPFRRELAAAHYCQGLARLTAGRLTQAEPDFTAAVAIQKQLAAEFPRTSAFRRELALSQSNLGNLLRDTGRLREAEEVFAEARTRVLRQIRRH